jgi:hypothetical protein
MKSGKSANISSLSEFRVGSGLFVHIILAIFDDYLVAFSYASASSVNLGGFFLVLYNFGLSVSILSVII